MALVLCVILSSTEPAAAAAATAARASHSIIKITTHSKVEVEIIDNSVVEASEAVVKGLGVLQGQQVVEFFVVDFGIKLPLLLSEYGRVWAYRCMGFRSISVGGI